MKLKDERDKWAEVEKNQKGAAQENKQEENTQIWGGIEEEEKEKGLAKKKVSNYKEMLKTIQNNVWQSWLPRKAEENPILE